MSLTYSVAAGATSVAALSTGLYVAKFQDGAGLAKDFSPVNPPAASTNASAVFPSIVSVSQVIDSAGGSTGPIRLLLKPATGDPINTGNPLGYLLDQDVTVLTVSGTFSGTQDEMVAPEGLADDQADETASTE
jgi:hypothetical protein